MFHNVISSAHIKNWIISNFPNYKERKQGDEIRICNPFTADSKYKLEISVRKGICNDWTGNSWTGFNPKSGLKYKCTFIRFVQLYLSRQRGSCSYIEALGDVLGSINSARAILINQRNKDKDQIVEKSEYSISLPEFATPIDVNNLTKLQIPIVNYLHSRKIDDNAILKYKLHSDGFHVVWPYYEFDELVYWQSRSILNKEFKFPSAEIGVTKGQYLYGFDQIEPASYAIITESLIDCQTLQDQTLATGGASLTKDQINKLKILGPKDGIILAPDNDKPGIESILHNAKLLQPFYDIRYSIPPKKIDNCIVKDWNDIAKLNYDALDVMWSQVKPLDFKNKLWLHSILKDNNGINFDRN